MTIDPRLFPAEQFRSCLNRALRKHGSALLGYGDRAGFLPLRETIAERLQSHGIAVTSDEVLITNGSQHGLDLVLRAIAAPGKAIAIESPTYDFLLPLLNLHGLRAIDIPQRDDGMDLDLLDSALRSRRVALVYTMPNFQNPTGVATSQAHRERLLSLCETHRVPILEDGFEEEMKYSGRTVLPIKSIDKHQIVIYAGTFSKVLFPGLRIGWIAADRACIERLIAIRCFSDLTSSMVLQAGLQEFIARGYYDRHVGRMHRQFRRRMHTALSSLRRNIPAEWAKWNEPDGGFLIWLELEGRSLLPEQWTRLFAAHGVRPLPGGQFFTSPVSKPYLRLSISMLSEDEITEGIRRLAAAMRQAHGGRAGIAGLQRRAANQR